MESHVLDAEIKDKKRKPLKVVKTGVLAGLVSLVFVSIGMAILLFSPNSSSGFEEHPLSLFLLLFGYFIPTSIAMFLIAAWGYRDGHFLKILATGLIGFQITLAGMFIIIFMRSFFDESIQVSSRGIQEPFMFNGLILVLAFILWLVPGKLPYFRKQVQP